MPLTKPGDLLHQWCQHDLDGGYKHNVLHLGSQAGVLAAMAQQQYMQQYMWLQTMTAVQSEHSQRYKRTASDLSHADLSHVQTHCALHSTKLVQPQADAASHMAKGACRLLILTCYI